MVNACSPGSRADDSSRGDSSIDVAVSPNPIATDTESSHGIVGAGTPEATIQNGDAGVPDDSFSSSLANGADLDGADDATSNDATGNDASSDDATSNVDTTVDIDASSEPDSDPPSLSVTVSPLELFPPFSPAIHDYAVRCSAGVNDLTLDLKASPGGTIAIAGSDQPATTASQIVDVGLYEDQAIVLDASGPLGEKDTYWIRCLPHDFPTISVTRHPSAGTPSPGWYLIGNLFVTAGKSAFAIVVDGNGTPVWYRRSSQGVVDVDHIDHDTISLTPILGPAFGSNPNGQARIFHLDTNETESVQAVGMPTDHHELLPLANGNRMVIAYPLRSHVDLTGFASYGADSTIADCVLQELDPRGSLVWEWRASDHVDPSKETIVSSSVVLDGVAVVDVFHCNSIDVNADGDLLVSARHTNAVFFVSKASGTIAWKMGGTSFNKDGAQLIALRDDPETAFYLQHDARFQPDGSISLFDDHSGQSGQARGVAYTVDRRAGTASVAWQYKGTVNSSALGSFRRYSDGSSVIGWGATANASGLVYSEIDSAGNDLFDLSFEAGGASYRAIKVPLSSFDVDVLRRTSGQSDTTP